MTPRELQFLFETLERAVNLAYEKGYEDGDAKHPKKEPRQMNKGDRLRIQTEMKKFVERR
jgi:gluconate kinase